MSQQHTKPAKYHMFHFPNQHEADEELLHEYLDDELVPCQYRDYSEFILCVTRVWSRIAHLNMRGIQDNQLHEALNIWTQKFCSLGGKDAAHHWDSFLSFLIRNVRKPFLLGCASCGKVSDDEKVLLLILHDIQSQDLDAARRNLSKLMWDIEIPTALHHLIMFESMMNENRAKIDTNVLNALDEESYTSRHLMH
ncbi:hypothetical protein [Curvivirga aplysinae]|uniref:hypothetical protein n=1 Tax=Curvivirga aplysinae TaxID=2529852 RepID=UPI0012BB576E|nr:hypothetical protein [Curvivirga aplysinae]MTI10334.1 hypothetical protein [Curvivirga aplysinae]